MSLRTVVRRPAHKQLPGRVVEDIEDCMHRPQFMTHVTIVSRRSEKKLKARSKEKERLARINSDPGMVESWDRETGAGVAVLDFNKIRAAIRHGFFRSGVDVEADPDRIFLSLDRDHSGCVSFWEFWNWARNDLRVRHGEANDSELRALFFFLDDNDDGSLELGELVGFLTDTTQIPVIRENACQRLADRSAVTQARAGRMRYSFSTARLDGESTSSPSPPFRGIRPSSVAECRSRKKALLSGQGSGAGSLQWKKWLPQDHHEDRGQQAFRSVRLLLDYLDVTGCCSWDEIPLCGLDLGSAGVPKLGTKFHCAV